MEGSWHDDGSAVERDLVFAARHGCELSLDIYRPPQDDAPVTIYLHGGGWRGGDKSDDAAGRLVLLSTCGVTVVSVNYRLVPRAQFPAQLHDVKAAVRWLRGNGPRLDLDTGRVGIWGAMTAAWLRAVLCDDRRTAVVSP
jgi:acetyl esterase/lipase